MTNSPNRAPIVSQLVQDIRETLKEVDEFRDAPDEVNCALAMCEVATALPPSWFSKDEQQDIISLIRELHGNPAVFLLSLASGDLSYVEKCRGKQSDKTLKQIIEGIYSKQKAFIAGV